MWGLDNMLMIVNREPCNLCIIYTYIPVQDSTQQYRRVQCRTVQYRTVHEIAQHCIAFHSIKILWITIIFHCITSVHPYIRSFIHTCIHTSIYASIHAYMHTCILAYLHKCIHAYSTCEHSYIPNHTYMHACICIHGSINHNFWFSNFVTPSRQKWHTSGKSWFFPWRKLTYPTGRPFSTCFCRLLRTPHSDSLSLCLQ